MSKETQKVLEVFPNLQRIARRYDLPDDVFECLIDCAYSIGQKDAIQTSRDIIQSVYEAKQ